MNAKWDKVYTCVYGRHKPGKVHKVFSNDGKVGVKGRELTLIDDESNDMMGSVLVPPHKEIAVDKLFIMGSYEAQLIELYEGDATLPPPQTETLQSKIPQFKAPKVSKSPNIGSPFSRSHPYGGSSAARRSVRQGGILPDEPENRTPDLVRERKFAMPTAAEIEKKPEPKKNKYSLF